MNLKEPIKKKRSRQDVERPFPIPINKQDEWVMYTAHLSASGTCIAHPEEIAAIYWMGFFGKGSLSRGFPTFSKRRFGAPPLIRERQWKRRRQWTEEVNKLKADTALPASSTENPKDELNPERQCSEIEKDEAKKCEAENLGTKKLETIEIGKDIDEVVLDSTEDEEICEIVEKDRCSSAEVESQEDDCEITEISLADDNYLDCTEFPKEPSPENPNELLVLPDSDSDTENYLKNVKPRIETDGFPVIETLLLTFEDTFFLMYGLGCLQVVNYQGEFLSIAAAWKQFNLQDNNFFNKYVVYHYFRSKGWVVKNGIKCGGDFVLYKKGPPFHHATYVVIIEVVDADSLIRDDEKTERKVSWNNMHSLNRLAQSMSKDLLVAQVLWPSSVSRTSNPVPLESLSEFTVREMLIRRWNPRENILPNEDEEEEDSEDEESS